MPADSCAGSGAATTGSGVAVGIGVAVGAGVTVGIAARASRTRSVTMASTVASTLGGSGRPGTGSGGAWLGKKGGAQARVNAEKISRG